MYETDGGNLDAIERCGTSKFEIHGQKLWSRSLIIWNTMKLKMVRHFLKFTIKLRRGTPESKQEPFKRIKKWSKFNYSDMVSTKKIRVQ